MNAPILATKFYIPMPRADLMPRPRLIDKLAQGVTKPLVLISAPAGFGKTTLLAEWRASPEGRTLPLAWLSLESEESDPLRFLDCLAMAIEPLRPGLAAEMETLVQSAEPRGPKELLVGLLQRINRSSQRFGLVLDDYHTITVQAIHELVAYLINHLPPCMHLLLTSRTEPPLPLARLRARGDLAEIRADDLRFTEAETLVYLQQTMGLPLSSHDAATLALRTEGWVAGLKLAALSLASAPAKEISSLVAAFAGSHRYIADYLVEEVLNSQPETIRNFLLQTSALSMLCGSLCDAVTGQQHGQILLEQLDQQNLFIVRLDDDRHWFRYHHLFAELLRHRLDLLYPGRALEVQRRAVAWYLAHEMLECAIDETLDAGEFVVAANLIERACPTMLERGQKTTLARWLRALPPPVLQTHRTLLALRPTVIEHALTLREREVLHLLGQGASNRAIAQTLTVSLGTVKKHLNNIFLKLDAQSRTQVVARARELGLL